MPKRLLLLCCVLLAVGWNCRSPRPQNESHGQRQAPSALQFEPESLIAEVEAWRDREFAPPPTVSRIDAPPEIVADAVPESVDRDRQILARALFGLDSPAAVDRRPPFGDIARYDAEDHTVEVHPGDTPAPAVRAATAAALVDALDHQHFDTLPDASSWDGALALRAAEFGDRTFVAALAAADGRLTVDELATRPEVVADLAQMDRRLKVSGRNDPSAIDDAETLQSRLDAFTIREGLSLTAAFLRAGGWSGAEALYSLPPRSTTDVVRPDRWMDGGGLGDWQWPDNARIDQDAWTLDGHGRVGPAVASVLIGQKFPAQLARTIYSGFSSDAFRWWTSSADDGDDEWRFEWVSLWETPAGARQIRQSLERVLSDHESMNTAVLRRGLKVVVVSTNTLDTQTIDDHAVDLADANVAFEPQRPLPLSFVPTHHESFRESARGDSIDEQSWHDPASGVSVDLSAVDGWTIRRSKTLPLRWFARHPDGAVLQLSTELIDPLGPEFGTDPYARQLRGAFKKSFESPEISDLERLESPVDPTLTFEVSGKRRDRQARLRVWHFRRDDVLVTLSIQAPASQFDTRLKAARKVLDAIELEDSSDAEKPDQSDKPDDDGSIEYEIESDE